MSLPPPPAPPTAPSSATPHRRIAERLVDGRSAVGQVAVSPDGRHIAFVVATTNLAKNTTTTLVWIDDAPVTAGPHDANPTWSPDGRHLAFTSRRGEKQGDSTLHVLPVGGVGVVRALCTMPDGLDDVAWSPDGRTIAFTSRTRDERYGAESAAWQSPRKVERLFSRLNGENWVFDRPMHVYAIAADGTGIPRNLTPGEFQHKGVSWLRDSSAIVTSAQRHDTWDRDRARDLYIVDIADHGDGAVDGENVRALTGHDGAYGEPSVSPDGTLVAFIGFSDTSIYPQNDRIGVLPIDGEQHPHTDIRWVSSGLDRTFHPTVGSRPPVWESDTLLLATAEDRGATHLYRLRTDGSGAPEPLTDGPVSVTSFDAAGDAIATARTAVDHPAELYVGDEQRTHVGDELAGGLLEWEHFAAPTADGTDDIDAWIMRPANFDETKRYPVLLHGHGGPHTQYGEYCQDEFQMQAAAGFVVVLGNPRGSSGRHTGWGQAIQGPKHPTVPGSGWGTVDVDDVLSIIDTALDRYAFCDRSRAAHRRSDVGHVVRCGGRRDRHRAHDGGPTR